MLPADPPRKKPPALPVRRTADGKRGKAWHRLTRRWWAEVWSSPMASQYVGSDYLELLALAELWDQYWEQPDRHMIETIRRMEAQFGLSPVDRRRLHWEIAERQQPKPEPRQRRPVEPEEDPRAILETAE